MELTRVRLLARSTLSPVGLELVGVEIGPEGCEERLPVDEALIVRIFEIAPERADAETAIAAAAGHLREKAGSGTRR
jgi:hypothetical protein